MLELSNRPFEPPSNRFEPPVQSHPLIPPARFEPSVGGLKARPVQPGGRDLKRDSMSTMSFGRG
jgi:hypothetical protein